MKFYEIEEKINNLRLEAEKAYINKEVEKYETITKLIKSYKFELEQKKLVQDIKKRKREEMKNKFIKNYHPIYIEYDYTPFKNNIIEYIKKNLGSISQKDIRLIFSFIDSKCDLFNEHLQYVNYKKNLTEDYKKNKKQYTEDLDVKFIPSHPRKPQSIDFIRDLCIKIYRYIESLGYKSYYFKIFIQRQISNYTQKKKSSKNEDVQYI